MEPARTALSVCAELPDYLPAGTAAPGPSPAPICSGACPGFSSPDLPSPFLLPCSCSFFGSAQVGLYSMGRLRIPHPVASQNIVPLCGYPEGSKGTAATTSSPRPLLQPSHVTVVKDEIYASGARQMHSSVLGGSLLSQAVPDPPSDSPVLITGGRGRGIILGYRGNHSLFCGQGPQRIIFMLGRPLGAPSQPHGTMAKGTRTFGSSSAACRCPSGSPCAGRSGGYL